MVGPLKKKDFFVAFLRRKGLDTHKTIFLSFNRGDLDAVLTLREIILDPTPRP